MGGEGALVHEGVFEFEGVSTEGRVRRITGKVNAAMVLVTNWTTASKNNDKSASPELMG